MGLTSRLLASAALSFSLAAGAAVAQETEPANDNIYDGYAFSCDAPDLAGAIPADVAEAVFPAQVYIRAGQANGMPFDMAPRDEEVAPSNTPPRESAGSGFIVDPSGYIVTNAHVLEGRDGTADGRRYTVTFYDPDSLDYQGEEVPAVLVGIDSSEKIDVAVLRVDVDYELPCVSFGDVADVRVFDQVFAIGNPMNQSFSLSSGIISHMRRSMPSVPYYDFIQTDTAINRGNSGGALFNMDGEVIGVNTAILSPSGGSIGIGFAIPADVVAHTADRLIREGGYERGYLGIRMQPLDETVAQNLGSEDGVFVENVTPDGPAMLGGLQDGDVILELNGEAVEGPRDLLRGVARLMPGEIARLTINRDGTLMELSVELGDRDAALAAGGEEDAPEEAPEGDPEDGIRPLTPFEDEWDVSIMSDENATLSSRRAFLAMAGSALGLGLLAAPTLAHADDDEEPETPDDLIIPAEHYIHPTLITGSSDPVGIVIGFGVDISSSIKDPEYEAELAALADTIERDDFRESIFMDGGPGSAAIFIADFDSKSKVMLPAIDFRENDPAKFRQVAQMIRELPRRAKGTTKQHAFLHNAMRMFNQIPWHCERLHVAVMTDGTGDISPTREARILMGREYGATISSFVTRVGNTSNIYDWCQTNLTTPPNTFTGPRGEFVPGGITVEVATEVQTRGDEQDVARYQDQVFLATRQLITTHTASLDMDWLSTPYDNQTRYAALEQDTGQALPRNVAGALRRVI